MREDFLKDCGMDLMKNNIRIMKNYSIRENIKSDDPKNIREIVSSTGFFSEEEVKIAVELAEERLTKGD